MTNYNDGKWHGHNGGECPVHPESRVKVATETLSPFEMTAKNLNWSHSNDPNLNKIIAFRVTKEHKEPREYWIYAGRSFPTHDDALTLAHAKPGEIIHVREVTQ